MRLILIRHADAWHEMHGVIAGLAGCTGLTDRGITQARTLARRLRTTGELGDCGALLSSPVLRARQTAEIVATALPVRSIEIDGDLCEVHPGEADGLTWHAYRERYGSFDLASFPDRPFAPGGESWSDFVQRVRSTLARLASRFDGQTVVAVSHAGFIVLSLLTLFEIPRTETRARIDPRFTSLTEWIVENGRWMLERYNDTSHLIERRPRERRIC